MLTDDPEEEHQPGSERGTPQKAFQCFGHEDTLQSNYLKSEQCCRKGPTLQVLQKVAGH